MLLRYRRVAGSIRRAHCSVNSRSVSPGSGLGGISSVMQMTDEEIYRKHAEELVRFATLLTGPDRAADVVSAAVVTAFGSKTWPTVSNPRAYLFRCVLNEARMSARSESRRSRLEARAALREARTARPDPSARDPGRRRKAQSEAAGRRLPDVLGGPQSGRRRRVARNHGWRGSSSPRTGPKVTEEGARWLISWTSTSDRQWLRLSTSALLRRRTKRSPLSWPGRGVDVRVHDAATDALLATPPGLPGPAWILPKED